MAKQTLLVGRDLADRMLSEVGEEINRLGLNPHIAIVFVGNDEASEIFVRLKERACAKVGVRSSVFRLEEGVTEARLIELIEKLDKDNDINGILVQLPLPDHIDENSVLDTIDPKKDVDGLAPKNIGNLLLGRETIVPCIVEAIMRLLQGYGVSLIGKNVVIVNRSILIGKPLAMVLIRESATVEICHTKTVDLPSHTSRADIIVTATGRPNSIAADMIKDGAVVVDAGFAKRAGKIYGDVEFDSVAKKASVTSPVPGGVGPVTVAMTMVNLLKCCKLQGCTKTDKK